MSPPGSGPILVVESDRRLGEAMTEQLIADGYRVELARSVEHARMLAGSRPPELALIGDLDAPRAALDLLEEIRHSASGADAIWECHLPAIVVSARTRELDLLRAFEAGADDFVARPARYLELRARMRALLHRTVERPRDARTIAVESLSIDIDTCAVSVAGRAIELRRMEFALLLRLAREPTRVFARAELLRSVWDYRTGGSTRTVDTHACRLRRKLDPTRSRRWVVSVWGIGYRLI